MKITFINSCRYLGGAELWQLRTAEEFSRRGHQVALMVRRGPLAQRARAAGLTVMTLPMLFDLDLYTFARAFLYFRREKPDLILLNDQRECRLIAPAAALAGIKVRVQRKGWPFLKGSWRDRLTYRYAVTHLIAASAEIHRLFAQKSGLPPDRIAIFPNGFELSRFQGHDPSALRERLGMLEPEPIVGSVGRLVPQKGFELLVKAMQLLRVWGLSPRLVIAGEGPMRDELSALAQAEGLGDYFILPGQLEDIPSFLAGLTLFVFPSRQEGRSNALAEAMAAGLPIIATDIPGNDELIAHEQTGWLVPLEDSSALAQAMELLLRDRELASRLGRAARKYMEDNLDADKIVTGLIEHLEGLIRSAQR